MSSAVTMPFWSLMLRGVKPTWWSDADRIIREAEPRRRHAKFNTGSITQTAAVAIRAVAEWVQAPVIVEVGTFIGVSTWSLAASCAHVYTCDASNDCLPSTERIHAYPYQTSTQMLKSLKKAGVSHVHLFFFDGLLSDEDAALVFSLSAPDAVYLFDDYEGVYKGVHNVGLLHPKLPLHHLMPRDGWIAGETTLAALVPESRL